MRLIRRVGQWTGGNLSAPHDSGAGASSVAVGVGAGRDSGLVPFELLPATHRLALLGRTGVASAIRNASATDRRLNLLERSRRSCRGATSSASCWCSTWLLSAVAPTCSTSGAATPNRSPRAVDIIDTGPGPGGDCRGRILADEERQSFPDLLHSCRVGGVTVFGDMTGEPGMYSDHSRWAHCRVQGRGGDPGRRPRRARAADDAGGPDGGGVAGVAADARPASSPAGVPGRVGASSGSLRSDTTSRPIALHSARRSPRSDGSGNSPNTIVWVGTDATCIAGNAPRARSDSLPFTRTS
jgi:hypothetical protein